MAATKDVTHLAQLSDTVSAIAQQLGAQRKVRQNVLAVLNQLLEANQAQSEMLTDILEAASEDAGPSPVAEALDSLAAQVQQLDENQTSLIAQMAELPEAVGRQFETSLKDFSAMVATKH
jgi:vacuolar-type H+-ATPase subunit I/STV1